MSTINYNNSYRTTGGLQRFDCLAWVNFNGTGTVAIRASGNVSSITDNGTGDYTVNFTSALPDANYAVHVGVGNQPGSGNIGYIRDSVAVPTTTTARIATQASSAGLVDCDRVCVTIFR